MRIKCRLQIEGQTCPYAGSDQSALIRHEKSVHGYYRKQAKAAMRNAKLAWDSPSTSTNALQPAVDQRNAQPSHADDSQYGVSSDSEESSCQSDEHHYATNFPAFMAKHSVLPTPKVTTSDSSMQFDASGRSASRPDFDPCSMLIFSRVEQEKCAIHGKQWSGVVSAIDLLN